MWVIVLYRTTQRIVFMALCIWTILNYFTEDEVTPVVLHQSDEGGFWLHTITPNSPIYSIYDLIAININLFPSRRILAVSKHPVISNCFLCQFSILVLHQHLDMAQEKRKLKKRNQGKKGLSKLSIIRLLRSPWGWRFSFFLFILHAFISENG